MSKAQRRLDSCNRTVWFVSPRRLLACLWLAISALLPGTHALAQSAPRPESLIKWRQSAFQVIAWNAQRIKGALAGTYDSREVQIAANSLASLANAGLPALFAPGTGVGKGWRETSARTEVFSDAADFRSLFDDFARETNTLVKLAAGGDAKAVGGQFLKVSQTCKACHDKFRDTD
jgi:cytochrome c556